MKPCPQVLLPDCALADKVHQSVQNLYAQGLQKSLHQRGHDDTHSSLFLCGPVAGHFHLTHTNEHA